MGALRGDFVFVTLCESSPVSGSWITLQVSRTPHGGASGAQKVGHQLLQPEGPSDRADPVPQLPRVVRAQLSTCLWPQPGKQPSQLGCLPRPSSKACDSSGCVCVCGGAPGNRFLQCQPSVIPGPPDPALGVWLQSVQHQCHPASQS